MCEIKARIRSSGWCGGVWLRGRCLRWPLLPTLSSPASFSLFSSVCTHFYLRVWCPFAHLGHTQNRLLIVKIQELKKMTAQRRIKKILHCSPHSLHVIRAHQAEVSLLIVSLLNVCCWVPGSSSSRSTPARRTAPRRARLLPCPQQLEANQNDNPRAPRHRPNDFYIKRPDVLLCHLPIPFQYRSLPK